MKFINNNGKIILELHQFFNIIFPKDYFEKDLNRMETNLFLGDIREYKNNRRSRK